MIAVQRWLAEQGVAVPDRPSLLAALVALGLVLLALLAGWIAGQRLGPPLTDFWRRRIGEHAEGVHGRLHALARHGAAAILLAIIGRAYPWPPLAAAGIGTALGAAAALFVVQLLRGVQ